MQILRLDKITLDKDAQPRLALSQDTINEYCESIIDGDEFPPVVVFKNGSKHYLADGFHRYEATRKAGCKEINVVFKKGDLRDAIIFSLSANSKHGLNRSISDKRKAVTWCLKDVDYTKKSARVIASLCSVSHTFVNQMRDDYKEKLERNKKIKSKGGNVSTSPEKTQKKQSTKSSGFEQMKTTKGGIPVAPEGKTLVDTDHYEEMLSSYEATLAENEEYENIMSADKPLAEAQKKLKKTLHKLKVCEDRLDGLMAEKNEAIRHVKSRDAVIRKLTKKLKDAGLKDF